MAPASELSDQIANDISPGASCTVPGNRADEFVGGAATVFVTAGAGAEADLPMSQIDRVGSGLSDDLYHRAASWIVDDPAASKFSFIGGDGVPRTLYQLPGEVDGKSGVFEWIVDRSGSDSVITHQRFIPGGSITGYPNQP